MTDLTQKTETELILDLMLNGLRVKNEKLNAVAAEILARQGSHAAQRLVHEAMLERNSPSHRVRVLAVLKRMVAGPGLDVLDLMQLSGLFLARDKTVREAAIRFFGKAGSAGTGAGAGTTASHDPVSP